MKTFAIIKNNQILNTILWDEISPFDPGKDCELVEYDKLKEQEPKFVYRDSGMDLPAKIDPVKLMEFKKQKVELAVDPIKYDCVYGEKLTLKEKYILEHPIEEKPIEENPFGLPTEKPIDEIKPIEENPEVQNVLE
jgi:hypothetical protein